MMMMVEIRGQERMKHEVKPSHRGKRRERKNSGFSYTFFFFLDYLYIPTSYVNHH